MHWNNIKADMKHNFNKCRSNRCDTQGHAYDTTSVMQYATWAFAMDRSKPSMTKIGCPNEVWPRDSSCKLGQYDGLAKSDIADLKKLYCSNVNPPAKCKNVQSDNNCQYWFKKGYCEHSHVSWMAENCKKTCGKC